jgi:hypothetical protein
MTRSLIEPFLRQLEDWRLRQHFKRVDAILRKRDMSQLPAKLREARQQYLEQLRDYAERGIFPHTNERRGYAPCFIDRDGRVCAVAHLMLQSGHVEVANSITVAANYAYIRDMPLPELDIWAKHAGFSKEELALIQPGYWQGLTGALLTVCLVLWGTGIAVALAGNYRRIVEKRYGIIVFVISILVALALLWLGTLCLNEAARAYYVGTHPDGWPGDLPLRDVGPLLAGGTFSLILALITGGTGIYRTWNIVQTKNKRG